MDGQNGRNGEHARSHVVLALEPERVTMEPRGTMKMRLLHVIPTHAVSFEIFVKDFDSKSLGRAYRGSHIRVRHLVIGHALECNIWFPVQPR